MTKLQTFSSIAFRLLGLVRTSFLYIDTTTHAYEREALGILNLEKNKRIIYSTRQLFSTYESTVSKMLRTEQEDYTHI